MTSLFRGLITVQEVAALAGVHRQTVRQWVKQGKLCPVPDRGKHGRLQFRVEAVEDRLLALGRITPKYPNRALVTYRDQLAQVQSFRPSMGYLIYLGPGSYQWVPEHALYPAQNDT